MNGQDAMGCRPEDGIRFQVPKDFEQSAALERVEIVLSVPPLATTRRIAE